MHQAIPQAVLRPSQRPSIVRGTLPFFDGFDVVDGPSLRPFINAARMIRWMCPVDLQPLVFAGKIDWECEFRIDPFNYSTAAFRRHTVQWP